MYKIQIFYCVQRPNKSDFSKEGLGSSCLSGHSSLCQGLSHWFVTLLPQSRNREVDAVTLFLLSFYAVWVTVHEMGSSNLKACFFFSGSPMDNIILYSVVTMEIDVEIHQQYRSWSTLWPSYTTSGVHPMDSISFYIDTSLSMFIAILFTISKKW